MKVFNEGGKRCISVGMPKIAHVYLIGVVKELLMGLSLLIIS